VSTSASTDAPPIEEFLAGLRIAWKDGEVRPTARPKPKQKRGRRRRTRWQRSLSSCTHGSLRSLGELAVSCLLDCRFEYPGTYRDRLLRTLQRRLKIWRSEIAHTMVFGAMHSPAGGNRTRAES